MKFDVYYPFKNKEGKLCPGIKPNPTEWNDIAKVIAARDDVKATIDRIRATEDRDQQAELKKELPAVCYAGRCTKTRAAANMIPTNMVMIDIDHVKGDPREAFRELKEREPEYEWWDKNMMICHVTPRRGLRLVFLAQENLKTLEENMAWFEQTFRPSDLGDFDAQVYDLSRISFMFRADELLFENVRLYLNTFDAESLGRITTEPPVTGEKPKTKGSKAGTGVPELTDEQKALYDACEYRGTPVSAIIAKYVEVVGKPGSGEVHNFYNGLVKNFRNILNNDKLACFHLLPRFGHSAAECWSSIESICRYNSTSTLEKSFFFFLKDNGFYKAKTTGSLAEYMLDESEDDKKAELGKIPPMPPVFRELVALAPDDFKPSAVNALLPILGTLASYVQGQYYFDMRLHTPSFFSVIYAPAGTGKGFVERYTDLLFEMVRLRDMVQSKREDIYLTFVNRKGDNEKSPENPHTSLRIMPVKNSEAEFLQKQQDNHGYHMFTYAAEIDSWAKGVRAAGGNKDDMLRVAWDNGKYGQKYKTGNTFNGEVNLYWNVLMTGTIQQLEKYFKDVENGLVTRCSFTTIPNQEFAEAPNWKELSKKALETVRNFMERCDANSYDEPCDIVPDDLLTVKDEEFDSEIDWRFHFRERQTVDMLWLRSEINSFLEDNRRRAALDNDRARDVFRRRCAVRGFRLGLICTQLWKKPSAKQLQSCIPFIRWWMDNDLESSLTLWGARYNNETEEGPKLRQRSLYNALNETFTKTDLYTICTKQGIKSPLRQIISLWKKMGAVEKIDKNNYKKSLKV